MWEEGIGVWEEGIEGGIEGILTLFPVFFSLLNGSRNSCVGVLSPPSSICTALLFDFGLGGSLGKG